MTRTVKQCLFLSLCVLGLAASQTSEGHELPMKRSAAAQFLSANPAALARTITPASVAFAERLGELEAVRQRMVLTPWISDLERLGARDHWEITFEGDCEDKALAGLEVLVERGWPRDAFGLFIRRGTEGEADHAVLCVSILGPTLRSATAWCLDPLRPSLQKLSAMPGAWRRMRTDQDGGLAQNAFLSSRPSSPTMPRRNVRTQSTKIMP